jgi:SAM-dependent methyltransferase
MDVKSHWEQVYATKSPLEVSWYQPTPAMSLRMIEAAGVTRDEAIIDVGGGASLLVDHLLDAGYANLTVLDISAAALEHARQRLASGGRAATVRWIEGDVLDFQAPQRFLLWHDRAVFHFLTDPADRRRYVQSLRSHLCAADPPPGVSASEAPGSGAQVIVATFAVDGPPRCSGLDVTRYDAAAIGRELGEEFELLETADETHTTPWGAQQRFEWFRFQFRGTNG